MRTDRTCQFLWTKIFPFFLVSNLSLSLVISVSTCLSRNVCLHLFHFPSLWVCTNIYIYIICFDYSLTSGLYGDEWPASRPCRYTHAETTPCTHCVGGWVGPRAGRDALENRCLFPFREWNPSSTVVRPVVKSLYRLSCLDSNNMCVQMHFLLVCVTAVNNEPPMLIVCSFNKVYSFEFWPICSSANGEELHENLMFVYEKEAAHRCLCCSVYLGIAEYHFPFSYVHFV
jgi:hypothetical protein